MTQGSPDVEMAGQRIWAGGDRWTGDPGQDHRGPPCHHQARQEEEENRPNILSKQVGKVVYICCLL